MIIRTLKLAISIVSVVLITAIVVVMIKKIKQRGLAFFSNMLLGKLSRNKNSASDIG
jgi:FtsH-binding integral membrane protein